MTVLLLLVATALAQEPTTDEVITAAELGGVEKVRDTVVPGLEVDVQIGDTSDVAFQLLAHTCTQQQTEESEKQCASALAEMEKSFTAFTSVPADIEAAPPRRRKGGFVVYLEDPDTGKIIFH